MMMMMMFQTRLEENRNSKAAEYTYPIEATSHAFFLDELCLGEFHYSLVYTEVYVLERGKVEALLI